MVKAMTETILNIRKKLSTEKIRWVGVVFLVSASCAAVAVAEPQQGVENSVDSLVETFSPPAQKNVSPPKYPRSRQIRNQEGWVRLNFMVDPDGKPYDITVAESSKDPVFESYAIESVEAWEYQPAVLNGESIDAGAGVFITFELQGGKPGASRIFVKRYKRLLKLISQDDKEQATEELLQLEQMDRNLYEEAYFNLARFDYCQSWDGDTTVLYDAITRAAAMDKDRGFLPEELLTSVLFNRFSLELKLNRLANALKTASILQGRDLTTAQQARIQSVSEQINAIRKTGQPFSTKDVIRQDNRAVHTLMHNRFALTEVDGDIAELRLHCDRGYVGFIFDPDRVYSVGDDWDNCALILIGTPDTHYTLVQGSF